MAEEFLQGQIKWYNKDKGYGFVKLPSGGLDVFIHANQVRKSGIDRSLTEGEKVRFRIDKGPNGSFATDITVLSA